MGTPVVDLLLGPTASGKSAVAFELARRRGAEILSVDSMKIYRGLEIGVAKPTPEQRAAVRYHLVDWKDPWQGCSVAEWLAEAERVIADCAGRGVRLIADGGTALYLKSLREGLFAGPGRDPELRRKLEQESAREGVQALYARLQQVDPDAARKILPGDLRRIVRALEVYELTGAPISAKQSQWGRLRTDIRFRAACLTLDRKELYRRIDARVEAMLAAGWVEECRRLMDLPQPLSREAQQALGYRRLFAHLRGELSLAQARERICFETHHFARRQLSWFRRFPGVTWVEAAPGESAESLANRVAHVWESANHANQRE
jgi:tRNA dimethylallyltransferase